MARIPAVEAAREIIALHQKGRLVVGGRIAVQVAESYLASVTGGCSDGNTCTLSNAQCQWPDCALRAPTLVYEAPRDPTIPLRVRGVSRVADEPRSLLLALTERPTDDQIRALHDFLRTTAIP